MQSLILVDDQAEIAYALGMLNPLSLLLLGVSLASPPVALDPIPLRDGEFSQSKNGAWSIDGKAEFFDLRSDQLEESSKNEWADGVILLLRADGSVSQAITSDDGTPVTARAGDKFRIGFALCNFSVPLHVGKVTVALLGPDGTVLARSAPITTRWFGLKGTYRAFVDLEVGVVDLEVGASAIGVDRLYVPVIGAQPLTIAFRREPDSGARVLLDKISIARIVPDGDGFTSLFNGIDLDGWVGVLTGYGVEDGAIRTYPKRAGGNIYTAGEYDDFIFRFRFKVEPGSNNGIAIRAPLGGDAAYQGMEVQVLENSHDKYAGLKDWQFHGSIYGIAAAERGYQRPPGEWNDQEIRVHGRRVTVTLNGHVITDVNLDEALANGAFSGRKHPGAARKSGHIGFCGHGDLVHYTDLRIRPIVQDD